MMKPSIWHLAWRELACRWVTAFSMASIIAITVAIVLLAELLATVSEQETRRIQRDIGLNIVILPGQTDLEAWWIDGMPRGSMPVDWIDRLQEQDVANRLVPMLVARVRIDGVEAILTGIDEERFKRGDSMKQVFGRTIEHGTVMLGSLLGRTLDAKEGEQVTIKSHIFTVDRVLEPSGSDDDVRAWISLEDAQRVLVMPDRINEIRALECHCDEEVADPLALLRSQLQPLVPGARIVRMDALADARRKQRQLATRILAVAAPTAIVMAACIVIIMAVVNVRERRHEIGVLRANAYAQSGILLLFLARNLAIGCLGGVMGWCIAVLVGPSLIGEAAPILTFGTFALAVLLTTACAALASLSPSIAAAMVDPGRLMRLP